jgi:hypothetical protein
MKLSLFTLLLLLLWTGCAEDPMNCAGVTCPGGYAVVRGQVLQSNNTPYHNTANDAVQINCDAGKLVTGKATASDGRYQFDLSPINLPQSRLWPCVIIAGGTGPTVRDTINVFFSVTRELRQTFVVNLKFP